MTETAERYETLPDPIQQFILHWGDMGGQWGVNRSVAQIHAYLYVSDQPKTAEDIAAALNMARSNVSNSIKELLTWKLIRRVPMLGDRRDHFEAETDIWEIVRLIAQGRKTRELDPAADVLRTCLQTADGNQSINPTAAQRMQDMLEFVEAINQWHEQMLTIPKNKLMLLIKMGSKVTRLLSGNAEITGEPPNKQ